MCRSIRESQHAKAWGLAMARHFFLVSYDISDDKRRTRVYKALLGFGDHVQYSVFCCQLNKRERVQMEVALKEHIHHETDQILVLEAGVVEGQNPKPLMDYIGRTWSPAPRVQVV